jgi:hypothetical protein
VALADDVWTVMVLIVFTWTLDGSGQLQSPAKFIPGKYFQIPTEYGDGSAADRFWTFLSGFLRGEKLLALIGIRTQIVHPVAESLYQLSYQSNTGLVEC